MPNTSMAMPSQTRDCPKFRDAFGASLRLPPAWSLEKNWKIVKPKLMSEIEVRITDMSVRSAASRVRWNAIPVRRMASSVLISAPGLLPVTRAGGGASLTSFRLRSGGHGTHLGHGHPDQRPPEQHQPHAEPAEPVVEARKVCGHLAQHQRRHGVEER